MNPLGLAFVAFGLYAICAVACDWNFFMNSRKARFMVGLLGRNGARVFYGVLGAVICGLGVLLAFGWVKKL